MALSRRTGVLDDVHTFEELQEGLEAVVAANSPGSGVDHVLVALPSFSVGETVLSHYEERIPALEHRFAVAALLLHRIESCEMVFVSSQAPGDEVVDYYISLMPPERRASARARLRTLEVPDRSPRAMAAKLLDRPDVLDELRASFGGRPVLVEPWNVTDDEVDVAVRLQAPVNGTHPRLWPLGYKSAGRRLFAEAGVPAPLGVEDVRSVDDVVAAAGFVRQACPDVQAVVVKHDNSAAGDGNVVVELRDADGSFLSDDDLRARVEALPDWYLLDLKAGGVVEELVVGSQFTSPSAQIDMLPSGDVRVLSTHEQVLSGQVYTGCRFPADPPYAAEVARYGRAVGERLAAAGARGRAGVDFVTAVGPDGRRRVLALEINLRKGGTTHPFAALRNLVPGRYDSEAGQWLADADGKPRAYCSTDNLVDERWLGLAPAAVIDAVRQAGLEFDYASGTGVVLHMLSCLAIDGRFGLTAIGRTPDHAQELYERTAAAIPSR